jgi:hypothetical protein
MNLIIRLAETPIALGKKERSTGKENWSTKNWKAKTKLGRGKLNRRKERLMVKNKAWWMETKDWSD